MKFVAGFFVGMLSLAIIAFALLTSGSVAWAQPTPPAGVLASPLFDPQAQTTDTSDMTITLSERYMNRQVGLGVPPSGQVSNVTLDLHSGATADVNATVRVSSFLSLPVKLNLSLTVVGGRIVITVQNVAVGGFGVPTSLVETQISELKTSGERELNRQFAAMEQSAGLKLKSLATTESSLTLSFAQ